MLNFQVNKILRLIPARYAICEKEGKFPEMLKVFFKCGIVLFRRQQYEKGFNSNDIQPCEIEYAKYADEKLLENYNKLYKLITLKHGELI